MKILKSTLITLIFFMGPFLIQPVGAETRFYSHDSSARGKLVETFLDSLESAGIHITIRKFFDEKKDGRLGFSFWLHPGKTHGEITFHDRTGTGGSFVKLNTQNGDDTERFRAFFIEKMKLKEDAALSGVQPTSTDTGF